METSDIKAMAREFLDARAQVRPVASLPSERVPGFGLTAAYAVEAEFARLRMDQGRRPVGRKVGYASKAVWRALKLDTLVWAHMYDDTVRENSGPFATLSLDGLLAPRIEPEIVIGLKDLPDAWDWVAVGFEIIDCPFPNWQFKPADFVAAYGLHRALIVGPPYRVRNGMLAELTDRLATFRLQLLKNGNVVEEGSGRNALKSPALCLAELARITNLEPGEIVSTGTLTSAQPVAGGETWEARLEGLPVANMTLRLDQPVTLL